MAEGKIFLGGGGWEEEMVGGILSHIINIINIKNKKRMKGNFVVS